MILHLTSPKLFSRFPVLLCPPEGWTLGCNPWLPRFLLLLLFGQWEKQPRVWRTGKRRRGRCICCISALAPIRPWPCISALLVCTTTAPCGWFLSPALSVSIEKLFLSFVPLGLEVTELPPCCCLSWSAYWDPGNLPIPLAEILVPSWSLFTVSNPFE